MADELPTLEPRVAVPIPVEKAGPLAYQSPQELQRQPTQPIDIVVAVVCSLCLCLTAGVFAGAMLLMLMTQVAGRQAWILMSLVCGSASIAMTHWLWRKRHRLRHADAGLVWGLCLQIGIDLILLILTAVALIFRSRLTPG